MRKLLKYLIIVFLICFKSANCQTVYTNQLQKIIKLPKSRIKDSLMVATLFQLSHIPCTNFEIWRDSLKSFSVNNKNKIGLLVSVFFNSDSLVNQNELLNTAKKLEQINAFSYASLFYNRIGAAYTLYYTNKIEQNKAVKYYKKAISLALQSKSNQDIIRAYDYLGEHYYYAQNYRKSIEILSLAKKLIEKFEVKSLYATVCSFIAADYTNINNLTQAEYHYRLASNYLEIKDYDYDASYKVYIKNVYLNNASNHYLKKNQSEIALKYSLLGLKTIELYKNLSNLKYQFYDNELSFLENMHKIYFLKNDFKNAYTTYMLWETLKNKKGENSLQFRFDELNVKYQTEQNKLKITALENANLKKDVEKQSTLKFFSSAVILLLLIIIWNAFYSNRRLKTKNKEISEALLKGQTIERQRVAMDLHDNLGSTLSALWLSVDTIDKSKMNAEEKEVHQNLRENLEKAYNDVRLLSHNLLPEEFEKQGLTKILQGFVRKINKNSTIHFDLKIDKDFGRVDNKIEFELYSICLELVNNIMKHSKATEAKIELSRTEKQIKFVVSDNGIGTFKNESDGKGMKNVKARVESLNGTWDLQNTENQGVRSEVLIPV